MKHHGRCRICGKEGKLSEEHIPPKGAENRGKVKVLKWVQERFVEVAKHGNGSKVFAICKACNTLSNEAQYDDAYISLIQQFLKTFSSSALTPTGAAVNFLAKIDRRLFIKRVMFQFLATNQLPLDSSEVKALRESILDKGSPLALFGKVFLYAQPLRADRHTGIFQKNESVAQELATYPIATLWDLLGNLPTQELFDISSWATASPGQVEVSCSMVVLPATGHLPMDSASLQEISIRQQQNIQELLKPLNINEARGTKKRLESLTLRTDLVNQDIIVCSPRDYLHLLFLKLVGEWENS